MASSTTGSLTTTGYVTLTKKPEETSTLLQLSGTYGTVTLTIEGSYDATVFAPLAAVSKKLGTVVTGTLSPSDNESLLWVVPSEHLCAVRVHVTAIASGTAEFALKSDSYLGAISPLSLSTSATLGATSFSGDAAFADSVKAKFGDGNDVTLDWNGTNFEVLQASTNSAVKWGVDGAGLDQVWYTDTASTNVTLDQSADALILNGAIDLQFTGTTGQPEIVLTDNLADALSVKISGGNDLLVFTTTDSGEQVSIPTQVKLGTTVSTENAAIKGVYYSGTISVSVPSITDPDIAKVDVDVSSLTFAPAVGDAVIAIPLVALPSNCRYQGAQVSATDTVQLVFGSEGGNVTGASKNFGFLFIDLT